MNHDEIILRLDNPTIIRLLSPRFGHRGVYGNFQWVATKDLVEWKVGEISALSFALNDREVTLGRIKHSWTCCYEHLMACNIEESLLIEKTIEFPIIKGEDQYKVTKGFIDIILHIAPESAGPYRVYEDVEPHEYIIEVKRAEDFKDFGAVLQQIKEYREYYISYGVHRWKSKIISRENRPNSQSNNYQNVFFCVLSTNIPPTIKKLFEEQGILCLELDNEKSD